MNLQGLIPIIDAGHGYLIAGQYQTAGKRSPEYQEGVLYEGVSNKHFAWELMQYLSEIGVPFETLNGEPKDISLRTRVNRANKIYAANPNTYVFSIHSNAGGGTGIEGFTSRGETKSDKIAELFLAKIEQSFPKLKMRFDRFDGDRDKEADYFILKNTNCPAFLLEILFMDYYADYKLLKDPNFRTAMITVIGDCMKELYYGKN